MKTLPSSIGLPPLGGAGPAVRLVRRTWLAILALGAALLAAPPELPAADPAFELEYKVKAGYLFNFAKFVEWPDQMLPSAKAPVVIGVLGGTAELELIEQVLKGKQVNERPLVVKPVATARSDEQCHILFVSRTASQSPAELLDALGTSPTLLVGETELFAEKGGMIGFVREDESLRLRLNLEAATRAGLKVSSKMSNVARTVKTQNGK